MRKKEFISLPLMLTSIPCGLLFWFSAFYYLKGDYISFQKLSKLGMTISITMIFIARLMLEISRRKQKNQDNNYIIIDSLAMIISYFGIALSLGVIIRFFL
jgi:hypothetical protein